MGCPVCGRQIPEGGKCICVQMSEMVPPPVVSQPPPPPVPEPVPQPEPPPQQPDVYPRMETQPPPQPDVYPRMETQPPPQSDVYPRMEKMQPPQPPPPFVPPPLEYTGNGRTYAILAYIGVLWLAGLFAEPEKRDPLVRFHVGQGMILTLAVVASRILYIVLEALYFYSAIGIIIPFITTFLSMFSFVILAGTIGLTILGIMNVVNNRKAKLPIIGSLAFYK